MVDKVYVLYDLSTFEVLDVSLTGNEFEQSSLKFVAEGRSIDTICIDFPSLMYVFNK